MNLEELSKFAEVAEPTRPVDPISKIHPKWMQRFCAKIQAIDPEMPLMFAFHQDDPTQLLDLERKKELQSDHMPYHAPKAQAGLFVLNTTNTGGQGWFRQFSSVNEMQEFVRSHPALAAYPAIVGSGKEELAHFFPEGVAVEKIELCVPMQVGGLATLNLPGLKAALDDFATPKILNHPSNRRKIWSSEKNFWPHERVEKNIQSLLVMALQMRFMGGLVSEELPVPSGRTDVVLEERPDSNTFIRYLIELKAVRGFSSGGTVYKPDSQLEHCQSGILQALMNGKDLKVDQSFLCAFDTRINPNEDLKESIGGLAKPYQVEVCWYPVYITAAAVRVAGAAAHVAKA